MYLVQYKHRFIFVKIAANIFLELQLDPMGRQKFQGYLEGARNKLAAIECSLKALVGKNIIDEESFSVPLSEAKFNLEECIASGWNGLKHLGGGYLGTLVNLEVTLRSMEHSLGRHMAWRLPDKTPQPRV